MSAPNIPRTVAQAQRYVDTSEARWTSDHGPELERIAALRLRAAFVADCAAPGGPPNRRHQAELAQVPWLLSLAEEHRP